MLNITADNLPRVMQCNGSLFIDPSALPETSNPIRQEGIAAHWLIEQCYRTGQTADTFIDRKASNGVFISGDMVENTREFLFTRHSADKVEVEGELNGEGWRVGCRADRERLIGNTLHIDEFKYGYSIVEPEMNWTLLAHAFRFVTMNANAPHPEFYTFTVYQPRPFHPKAKVRSWTISYDELAQLFFKMCDTLANLQNVLNTGPACRNCPKLHGCPAAAKAAMNAVDVSETGFTDEISNEDLSMLLDTLNRGSEMLKQTKKAFEELGKYRLKSGQIVPNYSLEREMTNRKFHDYVTPEYAYMMTGIDLTKKALVTPAQAEKLGANPDIIKLLADRQESGMKLARIDDSVKAKKLFGDAK